MYVGLSQQMLLQRKLDIVANNIANADTNGFKVENLMTAEDPVTPPGARPGAATLNFVLDQGVARDFSQGPMITTGSPLDLAINGAGFFQVQTANGVRYTRDGRFTTNAQGQLVTQAGDPVLDPGGGQISLNAANGAVTIGRDGTITQTAPGQAQSQVVGKVGVVLLANLSALGKEGAGLFVDPTNQTATPATDAVVQQGMLEGSNVQSVTQITNLIELQRAYESVNSMISNVADLSKSAIQRLGSIQ